MGGENRGDGKRGLVIKEGRGKVNCKEGKEGEEGG